MADVHRADVLVRWIGLRPRSRPWETGRHEPTRSTTDPAEVTGTGPGAVDPAPVALAQPDTEAARVPVDPPGLRPAPPLVPRPRPDLARATPARQALLRRPTPRRPPPRGAVVDGIEHRPPVDAQPDGLGWSRLFVGRRGSRAFALAFLGIYLLILLQLIVSLMNY